MSNFFGVYNASGLHDEHNYLINELIRYWLGLDATQKNRFMDEYIALMAADYGQYHQSAWHESCRFISTLVGHPLLTENRTEDLETLVRADKQTSSPFKKAEGAYCFVKYDSLDNSLELTTDVLGLRPFYYAQVDGAVIFSTTLKFFEALSIPLTQDPEGTAEFSTLGYYLLDHTPFKEVKCVRPGFMTRLQSEGSMQLNRYFNWLDLIEEPVSNDAAIDNINRDFRLACEKYLGRDDRVLTTLSGGIGSRLITCELIRQNREVVAYNFSQAETQDIFCAREFSKTVPIELQEIRVNDTQSQSVESRLGLHWQKAQPPQYKTVSRPQLAWSGNGGSVGLGFIYCSEALYHAALSQNKAELASAYIEQQFAFLPASIVVEWEQQQALLKSNIIKSLEEFEGIPLEKAYYLFLLHNDQHHHLTVPYEEVDDYQMEFCLPIYSWKVLRHTLNVPAAELRRHKFYLAWLEKYYPEALKTPWQAYPGHIPCPHKIKQRDQWQLVHRKRIPILQVLQSWLTVLSKGKRANLNRSRYSLLCLLHCLHLKDISTHARYAIEATRWLA